MNDVNIYTYTHTFIYVRAHDSVYQNLLVKKLLNITKNCKSVDLSYNT